MPDVDGDRNLNSHLRSPVAGSIARNAPQAGLSDSRTRCPAPPVNRSPALYSGFHEMKVMQTSRAFTKNVRVDGSILGCQEYVPPVSSEHVTSPFPSGVWP